MSLRRSHQRKSSYRTAPSFEFDSPAKGVVARIDAFDESLKTKFEHNLYRMEYRKAKAEKRTQQRCPIEVRFGLFYKNYRASCDFIRQYLDSKDEHEQECIQLIKWIMSNEQNPYSYLPEEWAGNTTTASGFDALSSYIHHAMIDDGEITFYTVDDEPRIIFKNRHDEDFKEAALNSTEKHFRDRHGNEYEIKILNNASQFIRLSDEYHEKHIKRCFLSDSYRSVEWSANHYRSTYSRTFKEEWVVEALLDEENE